MLKENLGLSRGRTHLNGSLPRRRIHRNKKKFHAPQSSDRRNNPEGAGSAARVNRIHNRLTRFAPHLHTPVQVERYDYLLHVVILRTNTGAQFKVKDTLTK